MNGGKCRVLSNPCCLGDMDVQTVADAMFSLQLDKLATSKQGCKDRGEETALLQVPSFCQAPLGHPSGSAFTHFSPSSPEDLGTS